MFLVTNIVDNHSSSAIDVAQWHCNHNSQKRFVSAFSINVLIKTVMETHLDEEQTKTSYAFETRMQYQLVDEINKSMFWVYVTPIHRVYHICRMYSNYP